MPMISTVLYFISLAVFGNRLGVGGKASVCPTGSKQVGGICLRYHEGSYGWNKARSYCKTQYGTDLLIVRNDAVFRDIQHAVQNRGDHGFWVGATRQGHSFRWVDGSACCGHYWNPGEPDGASGSGDNCVHVLDSGSDKGLNDIACDDPIGFICQECPDISHCVQRHCTNIHDYVCDRCEDNYVFYKITHSGKKCERMCSFDAHACWPGTCSDSLTSSCTCATEFQAMKSSSQTMCQLKTSKTPTINSCQTIIGGTNGEAIRTTAGKCPELKDFYGNIQPTSLAFDMHSDFSVNITSLSKNRPHYIAEENFGITDTTLYVKRIPVLGQEDVLDELTLKKDANQSTNAESSVINQGNYSLLHPKYTLRNGERLCFQFEARGGGYLKALDFRSNTVLRPVPYQKTSTSELTCYRFDDAKPQHCLQTKTCATGTNEPLSINNRISRSPLIYLEFSGWNDPIPSGGNRNHSSGIDYYEIIIHEVYEGKVDPRSTFRSRINATQTSTTLSLKSDSPRLFCIVLEVNDVADNVQQARRFVLYDDSSYITSRTDKLFVVSSASKSTNCIWQTNHDEICLDWKDHFYNRFYLENNVLGPIQPDPNGLITGIYEQDFGVLPVTGTPNVYGITAFMLSSALGSGLLSDEIVVPNFENQTYCQLFNVSDGESYTFNVRAVDIVNNTFSENKTVHIDRTLPIIRMKDLSTIGNKHIIVYNDTDLSKLQIHFAAMDPHSGIHSIEWKFGLSDPSRELISDTLAVRRNETVNCRPSSNCYCPDVGDCEMFDYTLYLTRLVALGRHNGINNKTYWLTVNVSNNAMLFNTEHVEILIDILCSSSPEIPNCVDKSCRTDSIWMCETCSPGYSAIGGNTSCFDVTTNHDYVCDPVIKYNCYIIFKHSQTWFDAKNICSTRNSSLFVPGNMEEELFLEKYLTAVKDILHFSQHQFWIGGRVLTSNEYWLSYKDSRLSRWAIPQTHKIDDVCIVMDGQYNFMWNRISCDQRAFFICKETAPYHTLQSPSLVG